MKSSYHTEAHQIKDLVNLTGVFLVQRRQTYMADKTTKIQSGKNK